jgi:hypothetical protein
MEIVNRVQINYEGKIVKVILQGKESETITFDRRKSWSHRKYVDKALEESGKTASAFMSYGWQM